MLAVAGLGARETSVLVEGFVLGLVEPSDHFVHLARQQVDVLWGMAVEEVGVSLESV